MTMPNFFIIGAPSCGTTSLHYYLQQHPQIFMSKLKEPHFFSFSDKQFKEINIGNTSYKELIVNSLEEYESLFAEVSDELAVGEASASYIYSVETPKRIKECLPQAKLIVILRNPVDRAYSNYIRCIRNGHESIKNFRDALEQEPIRIQNNWAPKWFYKTKGFYYEQLKRYFDYFPKEQIMVCLHDQLTNQPELLIKNIFDFLEVDASFTPNMSERKNISVIPKYKRLNDFLISSHPIKRFLKLVLPQKVTNKAIKTVRNANLYKPNISYEIKHELILEYKADILKLQELINRDLAAWLTII